jgi:hypothetical protein
VYAWPKFLRWAAIVFCGVSIVIIVAEVALITGFDSGVALISIGEPVGNCWELVRICRTQMSKQSSTGPRGA